MVTGIGGVFIKSQNPKQLAEWYQENLGVGFNSNTYVGFTWVNEHHATEPGTTSFAFFDDGSKYFNPSDKKCMINFRVKNLDEMLNQLRSKGVWVDEKVETYDYGKFAWCMDPEGNKLELWEPIDGVF